MLGDKIGEFNGQTIGTRVLEDIGTGPRTEVTDRSSGTAYGVRADSTVTYVGTLRPNGTIAGSGTGFVVTESGETATFRGVGVGHFGPDGSTVWRGSLFYETESEALSRLNGIAALFEYQIDASGKSSGQFYEWK
ncbi:hypothetical protein GV794_02345 [Nocardia cyriacigeorgica]|uniref:DUF3224 domain-containing protein n=1 Tax=Nocardia cyriacigeorgica TaxID=135487 RepID=A0A6P1CYK6_9NOCA|nr:hypothetical protein [Nocardia cyriacigeorgica]NEW39267.1 hypothetical protein [Nocardia cyriacigeorgica]NEW43195.1 hypothetical protein [Nocardia cyriacigeorgica]NEW49772.1 hypothetical protein [Nocardia cyriacigeorgica]NEW54507.1 hypothetical protein [Nocardia cyriacigeorgica]